MFRCRGRLFRRSKFGVFITLLVTFVFVSMLLDWSCWKDRVRLVVEDATGEVNVAKMLWEESRNQTDQSNESRETPIDGPKSMTKMANVSDDVIGSWTSSQPRPMTTVEPAGDESELLSCKDIDEISIIKPLGRGYTKVVELGSYRGVEVAVKRVKSFVKDVTACKARIEWKRHHECYLFANYKIMKEILLQNQLQHPNIIKLLGYCIRSENIAENMSEHGVVAVTELGRKFDTNVARKMAWKQRLEIAIDMADLLDYLDHSPLGSLIFPDFTANQFVWVGDKVKLQDMDDVSSVELACAVDSDCSIGHIRNLTPCVGGVCRGLNAKHNMNGAFRHVFQHILMHDGGEISSLREGMRTLSLSAANLHSRLKKLLQQEIQGTTN
ncbi:extracellular tyrosine-protein kinase PKDCC-like [Branchiostoma lanceolatum]|uniref:extracellular tyrosine-protein kinase PKDCC-like n=1 Tax=Branchiostoma lanceolatum TaxID=7740 RepID=UPI00345702C5